MNRDEAAAKVREGAMHVAASGKPELSRELHHVADAIQTNRIGEPTLWDA